jgi:hypothetical protein
MSIPASIFKQEDGMKFSNNELTSHHQQFLKMMNNKKILLIMVFIHLSLVIVQNLVV